MGLRFSLAALRRLRLRGFLNLNLNLNLNQGFRSLQLVHSLILTAQFYRVVQKRPLSSMLRVIQPGTFEPIL